MYKKYNMSRLHHSNGSNLLLNFSKNTENTDEKSLEVMHKCYDSAWQNKQVAMPEIYKAEFPLLSLYTRTLTKEKLATDKGHLGLCYNVKFAENYL